MAIFYDPFADVSDAEGVANVAGLLDVSEFRVFEIAYRRTFGSYPAPGVIDRDFACYLESRVVPFWVRDLSRRVARQDHAGELHPEEYGAARKGLSPAERRRGFRYVAIFALVTCGYVAMLILALANQMSYEQYMR